MNCIYCLIDIGLKAFMLFMVFLFFQMLHCNLASRKILLGNNGTCKISDFGMARDIKETIAHLRKSSVGF